MLTRGLDMENVQQPLNGLKVPADTSLVCCTTGTVHADDKKLSKPFQQSRRENTRDGRGRMSAHSVFVLGADGHPLSPTTPAKARKLLEGGKAEKVWSKFGTFGIHILAETRMDIPLTVLGYDVGTKYEGIVVVSGHENVLSVKLDLPDKKMIVRRIEERRSLRRTRRQRNCRRRPARSNRKTMKFLTPSQLVVIESRIKVLSACFRIYPISVVGNEDICFNHSKFAWGANFSTMEMGKTKIRRFFESMGAEVFNFRGFETKKLRCIYGYKKTSNKSADCFSSHCSDALSIACEVGPGLYVPPCPLIVVDDTYRPIRRFLHDSQFSKGGIRYNRASGNVFGLRKGLLVGSYTGKIGVICGEHRGRYRFYDRFGNRQEARRLSWVSTNFFVRSGDTLGNSKQLVRK